jgi:two-component system, response regulator PdtaR
LEVDMFADARHVLIADDEAIIRLDVRQTLEEAGFVVCGEARDGLEAVELARTTAPDVAVFDVRMPRLDGIEAARRVYAERPIPIVMLTAYADSRTVDGALDAGAFAYVAKPFDARDLVPAVQTALRRHAELLAARRELGRPQEPLDLQVRSANGHVYPLRLRRQADGRLAVGLHPDDG